MTTEATAETEAPIDTNAWVNETEAEASPPTDEVEETTDAEEVEVDPTDDQPDAEDDDLEEVEWDGIKARVPPAIKAGLMRTADYTRKTQEIASTKQELEQRRIAVDQQAQTVEALAEDYGKVHALKSQVKAFEAIDWRNLNAEALAADDPQAAQIEINSLWMQYQQLKVDAETADKELNGKVSERRLQSEREAATATQETFRQLSDPKTGIKGWGQEKATTLATLAMSEGVTVEEIKQADARTWKLLDRLYTAETQLKQTSKASQHVTAQGVQPATTVKASATPHSRKTTDASGDGLSASEWAKRERERTAARR